MGFFSWLSRGSIPAEAERRIWLDGPGSYSLAIVGESHYQPALEALCGGRTPDSADLHLEACLVCEDTNPFDPQAVRIDIGGQTVGYLSRHHAPAYRRQLEALGYRGCPAFCSAHVRGGWDRGGGECGYFGVWLDLPTTP